MIAWSTWFNLLDDVIVQSICEFPLRISISSFGVRSPVVLGGIRDFRETPVESLETSIRKTWDGRWLNTLLSLAVVSFLICTIRDRLISKNSK